MTTMTSGGEKGATKMSFKQIVAFISVLCSYLVVSLMAALPAAAAQSSGPAKSRLHTDQIEQLTGAQGKLDEKEGVFKVSVPRTDLQVTAAGVKMTPALGLTSWAAFEGAPQHAIVMGDLVLTEDQVNPVMSVALDNGLDVTALHNHFFWESPRVMFMHIGGMGDEKALASAVGKVFAKIKETSGGAAESPKLQIDPAQTSVDGSKIDAILGAKGKVDSGIYKTVIGRTTRMHGTEVGNTMGVNTWAAFAGSDDNAVVDGDFAMLESELQPVLKALRKAGINIVAIHQHMTGEQPRVMFLHFWGTGATQELARGLRSALDRTATRIGAR
jgi:hypothetical protein